MMTKDVMSSGSQAYDDHITDAPEKSLPRSQKVMWRSPEGRGQSVKRKA